MPRYQEKRNHNSERAKRCGEDKSKMVEGQAFPKRLFHDCVRVSILHSESSGAPTYSVRAHRHRWRIQRVSRGRELPWPALRPAIPGRFVGIVVHACCREDGEANTSSAVVVGMCWLKNLRLRMWRLENMDWLVQHTRQGGIHDWRAIIHIISLFSSCWRWRGAAQ